MVIEKIRLEIAKIQDESGLRLHETPYAKDCISS